MIKTILTLLFLFWKINYYLIKILYLSKDNKIIDYLCFTYIILSCLPFKVEKTNKCIKINICINFLNLNIKGISVNKINMILMVRKILLFIIRIK